MRQNYKKDEASSRVTKGETIKRILKYCSLYKARVAFISLLAVIGSAVKTVIPFFTKRAVDVDIANGDVKGLLITVLSATVLAAIWGILAIVRDNMTVRIANEVVYRARTDAYSNILSLPLGFFDSRPSGRIITRIIKVFKYYFSFIRKRCKYRRRNFNSRSSKRRLCCFIR